MDKYHMPAMLDEPGKFILFTVDEVIAFVAPFVVLFMVFNAPVVAVMAGGLCLLVLRKLKGEQGHYFLYHLMYWHLPTLFSFKQTPPSFMREFVA